MNIDDLQDILAMIAFKLSVELEDNKGQTSENKDAYKKIENILNANGNVVIKDKTNNYNIYSNTYLIYLPLDILDFIWEKNYKYSPLTSSEI